MLDEVGAALRGQGIILGQELAVLTSKDVVCDCSYGETCAKVLAESQHKSCFSRAYGSVLVSLVAHLLPDESCPDSPTILIVPSNANSK